MKNQKRRFLIKDVDCVITVNVVSTQKEIFGWLDEAIENLQYGFTATEDDTYSILYKDGTEDHIYIGDYDGHKIRRNNIASMVFSNSEDYIVYGNFEMSENGIVYASFEEKIAEENIVEV